MASSCGIKIPAEDWYFSLIFYFSLFFYFSSLFYFSLFFKFSLLFYFFLICMWVETHLGEDMMNVWFCEVSWEICFSEENLRNLFFRDSLLRQIGPRGGNIITDEIIVIFALLSSLHYLHIIIFTTLSSHHYRYLCPKRSQSNKLAKLGDAIAVSNLKLSPTHWLTDKGRC